METMRFTQEIPVLGGHDVVVAGAGVAGVAAAVTARRAGRSVLLLEKSLTMGGLATSGLINLFVPMCNGRGVQIIKGLCDELMRLSVRDGYDTLPKEWANGDPGEKANGTRLATRYSSNIFAMTLMELAHKEGVDLMMDCLATDPVMEGSRITGVVVQTKAGRSFCPAKVVIDATGDADLMARAGVPTVTGRNFFTYIGYKIDLDTCQKAVRTGNIRDAMAAESGGGIDLYGHNQPSDVPLYTGLSSAEVTDYLLRNQSILLSKLRKTGRNTRDMAQLPGVPQFRTTRRVDGEYTLRVEDAYRHFDDSVGAICDFDRADYLYEVPLRALYSKACPNLLTAGRSAAGEGYAWDVLRVIPPAIQTGQAAGEAAALAVEMNTDPGKVSIAQLQARLARGGVMIHFDDKLIPDGSTAPAPAAPDLGHI